MKGFMDFVREQGVVGLAVAFILGGAISAVMKSLVESIINPLVGLVLGSAEGLKAMSFMVGDAEIMFGSFVSALLDFAIIAFVVYYIFKKLGLDKMDKEKKEDE
jgi:large conductance mechanosensitive channel